ncbi:MAG TPA: LysM peptidoglycan-binding domain-containing protein, partial [Ramlibacter sp.]|nr:LysM peptidoglycan-binding domain-containing protein [Ramlibacter sp.]
MVSQAWSAPVRKFALLALAGLLAAGCASPSRAPAPVVDRSIGARTPPPAPTAPVVVATPVPSAAVPEPARPLPGAENAGRTGYYTVQRGDTLIRIALDNGQNWRDLVRWNNIENPNLIEVGQVLRVTPPGSETVATRPVTTTAVTPVPTPPASAGSAAGSPASAASAAVAAASAPTPSATAPRGTVTTAAPGPAAQPAVPAEDEIAWSWPAPGNTVVLAGFDEVKNKGLDISGKAGDPVLAAADGRVVYAGAGLRGYGNL